MQAFQARCDDRCAERQASSQFTGSHLSVETIDAQITKVLSKPGECKRAWAPVAFDASAVPPCVFQDACLIVDDQMSSPVVRSLPFAVVTCLLVDNGQRDLLVRGDLVVLPEQPIELTNPVTSVGSPVLAQSALGPDEGQDPEHVTATD